MLTTLYGGIEHPIRRRIIEYLQERNELSFGELVKYTDIRRNHGKLGYHLRKMMSMGLVEYKSSIEKYRLTERGHLAGELIWDTHFLIARQPNLNEPTRYVRHLGLRDHAVLFYDTEDIKRELSYPFLLAGLIKGRATVYLVPEHKLDSETREIQKYGINIETLHNKAFTIMSAEEWYLEKGKAKAETIIANWLKLLEEKRKTGFTALHAAGEMEAFFNHANTEELLRYEAMLGPKINPNLCVLCLYYTERLDENQFVHLNKSHGHSVFKGIAVKTK